jgi:hypothetical protein
MLRKQLRELEKVYKGKRMAADKKGEGGEGDSGQYNYIWVEIKTLEVIYAIE